MALVKVVRTLTYYGPEEWIAGTIRQSYVRDGRPCWLADNKCIVSDTGVSVRIDQNELPKISGTRERQSDQW